LVDWYLFPWTIQYIVGGVLAILVGSYIVSKNPKSWAYRYFFLFGILIGIWELLAFFHRNAPTAAISMIFLKFDVVLAFLSISVFLLFFLTLLKNKPFNLLSIAPALALGAFVVSTGPLEVFWTSFGWSFRFIPQSFLLFAIIGGGYFFSIVTVGWLLVKKSKIKILQRKYILMLGGYIFFFLIGIGASNFLLMEIPEIPPLGGILSSFAFLVLAYAVALPAEKIVERLTLETDEKITRFRSQFTKFLEELLKAIPGKELGESAFEFRKFLDVTSLNKIVSFNKSKILVEESKLSPVELAMVMEKVIIYLNEKPWANKMTNQFVDLFISTYATISLESQQNADEWIKNLFHRYGNFLSRGEILNKMPAEVKIPQIFKMCKSGKSYLIENQSPKQAFKIFRDIMRYNLLGLCISTLYPNEVKKDYELSDLTTVFWLSKVDTEYSISPSNLGYLRDKISAFISQNKNAVVMLEGLEYLITTNGFDSTLKFLHDVREAVVINQARLIVPLAPAALERRQLEMLRRFMEVMEVKEEKEK